MSRGVGGRHIVRRRISRAQQTKNWRVGFSFPPPAYAGIHPTLYLFGFRANALNSHSPLSCLALIGVWSLRTSGAGGFGGFVGLRAPPGASGGLPGLRGFGGLFVWTLGLVVGFTSCSRPYPCLAVSEISAFPGHLQGRPGQWGPQAPPQKTPEAKVAGFRVS